MVQTNYNENTGQQEYWNNANNQWTPYNPEDGEPRETYASPVISIEDIKNRTPFSFDQDIGLLVADPNGTSPTDPNEYDRQIGLELGKRSFQISGANGDSSQYDNVINGLKDINPQAYYTAKISALSSAAGNNLINNEMGRVDTVNQWIRDLLPEAQKAGITPEQINKIYEGNFSEGTKFGQQILAGKGGGAFLDQFKEAAMFIGPALLGMYGIDAALGAGLSATGAAGAAGAGAIDSTAVALGGAGGGGLFAPAAGASFNIIPGAAYTTAGLTGLGEGALSTADILASTGFTPTSGSSFAIDPTASYTTAGINAPSYVTQGQMGPTYQELGVTGVEGGFAGPTYEELGYSGLNQNEAIAAADAASKGLSAKDVFDAARQGKKIADLLTQGGSQSGARTGATGSNPQQLAAMLGSGLPTQAAPGGLYRMNQNPFSFGQQGQSVATPGTYDVSGTNAMANALRKA